MSKLGAQHRETLEKTFRFIEYTHRNDNRLRPNEDGSVRCYVHHPMEVALFFAEMEIFHRNPKNKDKKPEKRVDKILDVLDRASRYSKAKLKEKLFKVAGKLDADEFTVLIGLLCHDTIESSYNRDTANVEKNRRAREGLGKIGALHKGADEVVALLTDSRRVTGNGDKQKRQIKLAGNARYAALKKYDMLVNMFDEAQIPDEKRSTGKKIDAMNHMFLFMHVARSKKHIPKAYMVATQLIYERAMAKLTAQAHFSP